MYRSDPFHLNQGNQVRLVRFSFVTKVVLNASVILKLNTPQAYLPNLAIAQSRLLPDVRYEFESDLLREGILFPISELSLSYKDFPLQIEIQIGRKILYQPQQGLEIEELISKSIEKVSSFSLDGETLEAVQIR